MSETGARPAQGRPVVVTMPAEIDVANADRSAGS
jgi:hypothetical protein